VDLPRRKPEDDPRIKARIDAAVAAVTINLIRAPRPYSAISLILAVLMAALNVPFGIMLGLLGERLTRPKNKPK
jgi:hypothetical protein